MAEFLYFKYYEQKPYLIFTDSDQAYITFNNKLMKYDETIVDNIEGNPILIFNQENVWYPLMNRNDDVEELQNIVNEYSTTITVPVLTRQEKQYITQLKQLTEIKEDNTCYLITAGKLYGKNLFDNNNDFLEAIYPEYRFRYFSNYKHLSSNIRTLIAYRSYISNLLSPATSKLAAILKYNENNKNISNILNPMSQEYLKYTYTHKSRNTSGLEFTKQLEDYFFNIDDHFLSKFTICYYVSINLHSIINLSDIKDIDNYIYVVQNVNRSGGHVINQIFYKDQQAFYTNLALVISNYDYLTREKNKRVLEGIFYKDKWINIGEDKYINDKEPYIITNLNENDVKKILINIQNLSDSEINVVDYYNYGHNTKEIIAVTIPTLLNTKKIKVQ